MESDEYRELDAALLCFALLCSALLALTSFAQAAFAQVPSSVQTCTPAVSKHVGIGRQFRFIGIMERPSIISLFFFPVLFGGSCYIAIKDTPSPVKNKHET